MRHFSPGIVLLLVLGFSPVAVCQDTPKEESAADTVKVQLSEHEQAAKDFKFEKIALGIELKAFHTRFPNAVKLDMLSDKKLGKEAWYLTKEDGQVNTVNLALFVFFESKLYQIRAVYDEDDLIRLGGTVGEGVNLLLEKMTEKFGDRTKTYKGESDDKVLVAEWRFRNAARILQIQIDVTNEVVRLFAIDSAIQTSIKVKAKANADTGF